MNKKVKFVLLPLFAIAPICISSNLSLLKADDIYNPQFTIYGYLENIVDGYLEGVDVYIDDSKLTTSNSNGLFKLELTNSYSNKEVVFKKDGYEISTVYLPELNNHLNLGKISIDSEFQFFGKTKYKSSPLFNDWNGYSTRSMDSIRFKFESDSNNFIATSSEIDLFIDTGDVNSSLSFGDFEFKMTGNNGLFVYSFGKQEVETDISIFKYDVQFKGNGTQVYLDVPYSFLKINSSSIVGVNFVDNIVSKNICSEFVFDEEIVPYTSLKNYARLPIDSKAFGNAINDYNPLWISKADKKELIKNYPIYFADSKTFNSPNADNIYAKIIYTTESINFSFIGFGYFEADEYIKCVIHSSENVYYGWNLDKTDVVININADTAKFYINQNTFFDIEGSTQSPFFTKAVTYVDHSNYFTINIDVELNKFSSCIKSNKQGFRYAFAEFGNKTIYSPLDFSRYMTKDNLPSGDIAGMNAYYQMKSDLDIINIDAEKRKELTAGYHISFGNPNDTFIDENDDMFVDVERTSSYLNISIIGFGTFQCYETIKVVLHTGTEDCNNWLIKANDTSLMFNKEKCVIKTNITDFWGLNLISNPGTTKSKNNPLYEEHDDYFKIYISLEYSELNPSLTSTCDLRCLFVEMDFIGNIYNGGTFLNEMRYDGVPCGDPANQNSYVNVN